MSYMSEANAIAAALRGKAKPPGKRAPGPTRRNLQVLGYMRDFFAQNDQLPPMAHIAAHFGAIHTVGGIVRIAHHPLVNWR